MFKDFIIKDSSQYGRHIIPQKFYNHIILYSVIYIFYIKSRESRDSVVGIATSYGLDDRGVGVRVPVGSKIFSSPDRPDRLRSTQPPIQWVAGVVFPGVKRPGREVDHSLPTSAEVKKMWIYTSIPIRLYGVVLN
jgi:hypothetical protein